MQYRLGGIPGPVLRRARARATRESTTIDAVLVDALRAYGDETDRASTTRRGGEARAASLTPRERSDSARRAVQVRWQRYREQQGE